MSKQASKSIDFKPLSNLIFDPENPRLPQSVNGRDESQVINWMLENENVTELMASIAEKGFFPAEPLLVVESKETAGKYNVVEGNRRLTAVKILLNPSIAATKRNTITEIVEEAKDLNNLDELPVIVFENEDDLLLYLGYRHITGVQPWDALAKARYLKRIKDSLKIDDPETLYKSLAKIIGSRADHVKLLLTGLYVYEEIEKNDFFSIKDLDEKSIKFGVLYTAISNANIAEYLGIDFDDSNPTKGLNSDNVQELSRWMFEKIDGYSRLGESRNLRLLNKVVADKKALAAFRNNKSLSEAVLLTDEPEEIFDTSINEAYSKLQIARDYLHLITNFTTPQQSLLDEISKLARTISATIRIKLVEGEDEES